MIMYEVDSFFSFISNISTRGGKIDNSHKKFMRMFKSDIGMLPAGK